MIPSYRQLSDALFHAGTRSGSEFEYVDKANYLHFYVIDKHRSASGVLSYTTAIRALNTVSPHRHAASFIPLSLATSNGNSPLGKGVTCNFQLYNKGSYSSIADNADHPQDVMTYLQSDVFRLKASVSGSGWEVMLPNALTTVQFGKNKKVVVAVKAGEKANLFATVRITATSESNPAVSASAICLVNKYLNFGVNET